VAGWAFSAAISVGVVALLTALHFVFDFVPTKRDQFVAIASLVVVGVAALLLTTLPKIIGAARLTAVIQEGKRAIA
jgi:hypothetical protein